MTGDDTIVISVLICIVVWALLRDTLCSVLGLVNPSEYVILESLICLHSQISVTSNTYSDGFTKPKTKQRVSLSSAHPTIQATIQATTLTTMVFFSW